MIFVTVGVSKYQFIRLLKMMDELAAEIKEEVVFQVGSAGYYPKNGRCYDFMARAEFERVMKEARVVVCSGGVGTTLEALRLSKPVIEVPRSGRLGEHIDEHGAEFASAMAREELVYLANNREELKRLLLDPDLKIREKGSSEKERLVKYLRGFLASIERR